MLLKIIGFIVWSIIMLICGILIEKRNSKKIDPAVEAAKNAADAVSAAAAAAKKG